MLAQNVISTLNTKGSLSGLQLLLLENAPPFQELSIPQSCTNLQTSGHKQQAVSPVAALTKPLQRHLISLCLHNPYWNDFRILNHFNRRNTPLTMGDLQLLKTQCGLDNRETICNTLIRLSAHGGLKLNDRQISFIEKTKPEFRDRDLQFTKPGEYLVYECLFGRGIGNLGRVYVHLFVDMFTGYSFGELSQQRSLAVGLQILLNSIMPWYRVNNQAIQTVSHSLKPITDINDTKEFKQMERDQTFLKLGLQWQLVQRKFGVIEKFEKILKTNQFFESAPKNADSLAVIKPLFDQCLVNYNLSNHLFTRREPLQDNN
jgi:hypothetical protein